MISPGGVLGGFLGGKGIDPFIPKVLIGTSIYLSLILGGDMLWDCFVQRKKISI